MAKGDKAPKTEWGAAPIREDGLQQGPPVGAFSVLQPQGKGQDKEELGLGVGGCAGCGCSSSSSCHSLQPKMEKLYIVNKNKTRS